MNRGNDLPAQTTPPNSPKPPVIVAAVLIIAIIAGTLGYLLGRTSSHPSWQQTIQKDQPTSRPQPPTSTPLTRSSNLGPLPKSIRYDVSGTKAWEQFVHPDCGSFSLKYPLQEFVYFGGAVGVCSPSFLLFRPDPAKAIDDGDLVDFIIETWNKQSPDESITEFAKRLRTKSYPSSTSDGIVRKQEQIVVDGVEGLRELVERPYGGLLTSIVVTNPHNQNEFLEITVLRGGKVEDPMFDEIIEGMIRTIRIRG